MAKTRPPIHAFAMFLLVVVTTEIVPAEGGRIDQSGVIAITTQETVETEYHSERLDSVAKKPSQAKIRKIDYARGNDHSIEQSKYVQLPPASVQAYGDISHAGPYTNTMFVEKRRFQELTTPDFANKDNGRRPPPRASTEPGHSPGDGNSFP